MVYKADGLVSESDAAKRQCIEKKKYDELLEIADTATNPLISLYAVYKSNFESDHNSGYGYFMSYLKKWSEEESTYCKSFREQLSVEQKITILYQVFYLQLSKLQ